MTWYLCNNHQPPVTVQHPSIPPVCPECRQATVAAHHFARATHNLPTGALDWTLRISVNGDTFTLELAVQRNNAVAALPIPADVLAWDAAVAELTPTKQLNPPGGGHWAQDTGGYGGGRQGIQNAPAVPQAIRFPTVKMGQNDAGASFGIAHVLHGHPNMFKNGLGGAMTLANFKTNLQTMTGPKAQATGVRVIARQVNNARYALHGVRTGGQRALFIVDGQRNMVTAFDSQVLSGLGQNPVKIRDW